MIYTPKRIKQMQDKIVILQQRFADDVNYIIFPEKFILANSSGGNTLYHICSPKIFYDRLINKKISSYFIFSEVFSGKLYQTNYKIVVGTISSNNRCFVCSQKTPEKILNYYKLLKLGKKIK